MPQPRLEPSPGGDAVDRRETSYVVDDSGNWYERIKRASKKKKMSPEYKIWMGLFENFLEGAYKSLAASMGDLQKAMDLRKAKAHDAPSKKPPKEWWDKVTSRIAGKDPSLSRKAVEKIAGNLWYHEMSKKSRKETREEEGKEYGPAPVEKAAKSKIPVAHHGPGTHDYADAIAYTRSGHPIAREGGIHSPNKRVKLTDADREDDRRAHMDAHSHHERAFKKLTGYSYNDIGHPDDGRDSNQKKNRASLEGNHQALYHLKMMHGHETHRRSHEPKEYGEPSKPSGWHMGEAHDHLSRVPKGTKVDHLRAAAPPKPKADMVGKGLILSTSTIVEDIRKSKIPDFPIKDTGHHVGRAAHYEKKHQSALQTNPGGGEVAFFRRRRDAHRIAAASSALKESNPELSTQLAGMAYGRHEKSHKYGRG